MQVVEPPKPQPDDEADFLSKNNLLRVVKIPSLAVFFITLLAVISLNVSYWLLDIYVSFIPQIFVAVFVLYMAIFAMYARLIIRDGWHVYVSQAKTKSFILLIISVPMVLYILISSTLIIAPVQASEDKNNLTIATYNLEYRNDSIDAFARYAKENNIDIIALQEVSPEYVEQARQILDYDYAYITDCDCSAKTTEIAVISKYPISNETIVIEHQNGAILQADIHLDNQTTITVFALHIPPPFSQQWYLTRNDLLAKLSQLVIYQPNPTIVLGDFNTTIYAPAMQDFIETTDSKVRNIGNPSWPPCSWFGATIFACARIDHIYIDNSINLVGRSIADSFGSDHRPVIVNLNVD